MLLRRTAGLPQGVLHPPGQRLEALPALDYFDMLPAREGQHEVVQDVHERCARNRDAQLAHGGEVRQASVARRMVLREEHFLGRSFQRAPLAHVTLQGTQHAVGKALGMIVLQLAQQRDRHQLGGALEQRHDLRVPDIDERIGSRTPIASGVLRGQRDRAFDAARAALADAGLGRGQLLGLVLADVHVEANLLIGDSGSWHWADLLLRPEPAILNPTNPAPPVARRLRRLRRLRLLTTGHHECRSTG